MREPVPAAARAVTSASRRWRARSGAGLVGFVCLGLVAAASPVGAWQGEPSQTDTLRLSLREALVLAEGGNPAFRRAENQLSLNPVERRTTWLGELVPQVSLSLFDTRYTGNLQRLGTDPLGNPLENPSADWVYFSNTTQALNVGWSFQGRSLFDTHRAQTLVNRDRVLGREVARSELQIEVQRRYMDALEQWALTRAEEELISAREVDRQVAERLFSLALRTRVDVLEAELAVEQQNLALQRQDAAYRQALLTLRTSLGQDGPAEMVLEEEPLPVFDPSSLDAGVLVRRALDGNRSLARSELDVRRASVAVSQERNSWWPEVSMGFGLFRRAQERNQGALFDLSFDEDLDSQFYLRLSLPIFNNFFQNRRSAEQATVELENSREADREARLEVEERVRSAHLLLESEWTALRLAERSGEIAQEALRLAREEYRLGARSFEELRASFDREAETRRQVIQARYAFVDALLDLEAAVGSEIRPSVPDAPGASVGSGGDGEAASQGRR